MAWVLYPLMHNNNINVGLLWLIYFILTTWDNNMWDNQSCFGFVFVSTFLWVVSEWGGEGGGGGGGGICTSHILIAFTPGSHPLLSLLSQVPFPFSPSSCPLLSPPSQFSTYSLLVSVHSLLVSAPCFPVLTPFYPSWAPPQVPSPVSLWMPKCNQMKSNL